MGFNSGFEERLLELEKVLEDPEYAPSTKSSVSDVDILISQGE
jgi:hypothetical protein